MPGIKIQSIDLPQPVRLGAKAQKAATSPFPERHDGDHWNLNRKPWVHPWIAGRAGCQIGRNFAQACIEKEFDQLVEGEPTALVEEIVTPSAGAIGINPSRRCREIYNRVRTAGRPGYVSYADGEQDALMAEDSALGCNVFTFVTVRGGFRTVWPRNNSRGTQERQLRRTNRGMTLYFDTAGNAGSKSIPYPCIVTSISYSATDANLGSANFVLTASGYGTLWRTSGDGILNMDLGIDDTGTGANQASQLIPMNTILRAPGSIISLVGSGGNDLNVFVTVEELSFPATPG